MGELCMALKKPDRRFVALLTTALMVILLEKSGGKFPYRRSPGSGYFFSPQQFAAPKVESLLSTPDCGLSVIRVTPVSV